MKSNRIYEIYSQLPPWARGVTIIVSIVTVLFIAYKTYSSIKGIAEKRRSKKDIKGIKEDLNDLIKAGQVLSYSASQYSVWAGQLQKAFAGCGTDDAPVALILDQINNDADMLKLILAYGVRSYDGCDWLAEFGDIESNLPQALSSELDIIQKGLQNMNFAKKGIKYRLV